MAATTGLSQGDFTRLRVADQTGDMVDILTLLGSAGSGGDITSVTGSGAIAVAVDGGSREISVDLSSYATAVSVTSGISQSLIPYSLTTDIATLLASKVDDGQVGGVHPRAAEVHLGPKKRFQQSGTLCELSSKINE